ncbi:MAG: hypothetical protein ACRC1V_09360, partial [Plesiomonas sp.]
LCVNQIFNRQSTDTTNGNAHNLSSVYRAATESTYLSDAKCYALRFKCKKNDARKMPLNSQFTANRAEFYWRVRTALCSTPSPSHPRRRTTKLSKKGPIGPFLDCEFSFA